MEVKFIVPEGSGINSLKIKMEPGAVVEQFDSVPVEIQVIRREDLLPGDYLIIKCKEENAKAIERWAGLYFEDSKAQIGIVHDTISIQIIRDGGAKPSGN